MQNPQGEEHDVIIIDDNDDDEEVIIMDAPHDNAMQNVAAQKLLFLFLQFVEGRRVDNRATVFRSKASPAANVRKMLIRLSKTFKLDTILRNGGKPIVTTVLIMGQSDIDGIRRKNIFSLPRHCEGGHHVVRFPISVYGHDFLSLNLEEILERLHLAK